MRQKIVTLPLFKLKNIGVTENLIRKLRSITNFHIWEIYLYREGDKIPLLEKDIPEISYRIDDDGDSFFYDYNLNIEGKFRNDVMRLEVNLHTRNVEIITTERGKTAAESLRKYLRSKKKE